MSREALVTTKIEPCYFFPLLPPMKTLFSSFYNEHHKYFQLKFLMLKKKKIA